MANTVKPLPLTMGLDLVNSPLTKQEGSLIGCLNYEITDVAGYKRIDGYERYDGYPNGAVYEYYSIEIVAVNPADQVKIVPGTVISRVEGTVKTNIGVVLDGPFPGNKYNVLPTLDPTLFTQEEVLLLLQDGIGFLLLQDGTGVLRLNEGSNPLGDTFVITDMTGVDFEVLLSGSPIPGRQLASSPTEYINNIREYSALLRSQVQQAPSEIAGLYWFEDRLLAAVNTTQVVVTLANAGPQPIAMARYRWQGVIYRLVNVQILENTGGNTTYRLSIFPIGSNATVDDNFTPISATGVAGAPLVVGLTALGPTSIRSLTAVIGYFHNPKIEPQRGFTYLSPGMLFNFNLGTNATDTAPPVTQGAGEFPSDSYYIVGDAGATVLRVRLQDVHKISGNWNSNNATGTAQVALVERISGTRDYVISGDVLHTVYPTTGSSARLTVNGAAAMPVLAGTGALDIKGTKYVWTTINFYGQSTSLSAWGATGASRAFQANKYSYSTIVALSNAEIDLPKYIAFYASHLALGYASGSIQLSVVGQPYNFTDAGATEIATGDDITGLLEMPGDTLAIFAKRSIRRLTGSTQSNLVLSTISANSGCFDYTAVLIGQQALFTNANGVTSLDQTAAYGDFAGVRISTAINPWLRPRVIGGISQFETGGVELAYPVRSKNQYRLVLKTGEVVVVTITANGPMIMFMNHGLTQYRRVPYCISSEVSDTGLERLHTSWAQTDMRKWAHELDTGWGFDGVTFKHNVDIAHTFQTGSTTFWTAKNVRLFGESYGSATINLKAAGIEYDFNQPYHNAIQDISLPRNTELLYTSLRQTTNFVDTAARGLGIKLGVYNTIDENTPLTEPSHTLQVLMVYSDSDGGLQDG